MTEMTAERCIVECLKAHGVDTIFGLIASHTLHLYDALYDYQDSVRFIGGRHEHAVGFMADGYSRATGRPGVLIASGGPGAANSMGSMGEAYAASSQILQLTTYSPPGRHPRVEAPAGYVQKLVPLGAVDPGVFQRREVFDYGCTCCLNHHYHSHIPTR